MLECMLNLKRVNMKIILYIFVLCACCITAFVGLQSGLTSLWTFAISPYLGLLYILHIAKHKTAMITSMTVTVFLVFVGLYFLLDTTYMERNLGSKFSFLFIPIWQWTMLLVSGTVVYLSNVPSNLQDS